MISRPRRPYGWAAVGTLSVMIVLVALARALVVFQIATMTSVMIVMINVARWIDTGRVTGLPQHVSLYRRPEPDLRL